MTRRLSPFRIAARAIVCLVILGLVLRPDPAQALSLASCTVGATPVSFGAYDPISASPTTSSGSVSVSCNLILGISLLVAYSIALTSGQGSYTSRAMKSGSASLLYNLYTSGSYTSVWGDGSSSTQTILDGYLLGLGNANRSYTVYGRIPQSQNVPSGTYTDSILVTVTY